MALFVPAIIAGCRPRAPRPSPVFRSLETQCSAWLVEVVEEEIPDLLTSKVLRHYAADFIYERLLNIITFVSHRRRRADISSYNIVDVYSFLWLRTAQ